MAWNIPNNQLFPWMQRFCMRVGQAETPDILGDRIWVSSDYSFDNPKTDFDVIGMLFVDPSRSGGYIEAQKKVRQDYLPDGRTMGFKSMNDRIRQRAFFPFLSAADHLEGLCVSVAVDRRIKRLISGPDTLQKWGGRDWLRSSWKPEVFEQLMRVTHFIAAMVAGLSKPNQNVTWYTDDDAIIPNDDHARDTGAIFTKLLQTYSPHTVGSVEIGRTSLDDEDCLLEDLSSLADLAAGSTAEYLTDVLKEYGDIPTNVELPAPATHARTANFLTWFWREERPLRRFATVLYLNRDGKFASTVWHFERKRSPIVLL
jgi:hypothetical protein